jgi:hypothetical protein
MAWGTNVVTIIYTLMKGQRGTGRSELAKSCHLSAPTDVEVIELSRRQCKMWLFHAMRCGSTDFIWHMLMDHGVTGPSSESAEHRRMTIIKEICEYRKDVVVSIHCESADTLSI